MSGLLLYLHLTLLPHDSAAFANALMREGDYFRAITEYKRVLFYSRNEAERNYCLGQIAKSYRKSARYESAIRYSTALLNKPELPAAQRRQSLLNLGLSYLESKAPQLAQPYFQQAIAEDSTVFPLLCMGLTRLEMRQWNEAAKIFEKAALLAADSVVRMPIVNLAGGIARFKSQPQKSPLLASSLSFFLPGSGQFYSGHAYDGIQAFLFTASFAFATYAIYKYEHANKDHLSWTYVGVSITSIFHAANILGANRTAHYRNWKKQQDFTASAREIVMRYEE